MRRALLLLIATVIVGSCASLSRSPAPPPAPLALPTTVFLGPGVLPDSKVCVSLALSYRDEAWACATVQELRVLLRSKRES